MFFLPLISALILTQSPSVKCFNSIDEAFCICTNGCRLNLSTIAAQLYGNAKKIAKTTSDLYPFDMIIVEGKKNRILIAETSCVILRADTVLGP